MNRGSPSNRRYTSPGVGSTPTRDRYNRGLSDPGRGRSADRNYINSLRDRFGVQPRQSRPTRGRGAGPNRGAPERRGSGLRPATPQRSPLTPPRSDSLKRDSLNRRQGITTSFRVESDRVRELRRRFGLPDVRGSTTDLPRLNPRTPVGARPLGTTRKEVITGKTPNRMSRPDGRLVTPGARGNGKRGAGAIGGLGRRTPGKDSGRIVAPGLDKRLGDRGGKIGGRGDIPGARPVPSSGTASGGLASALTRVRPVTPSLASSQVVVGGTVHVPIHHHSSGHGFPYLTIGYPYLGYYSIYGYPYLSYYGCDYYSNFYVRFGHFRFGLYSACSPFYYGYGYRHYHRYRCYHHSCYHYYRLRDCHLCYDTSPDYVIYDTVIQESPQAEERVQSLTPGELSFCEGWVLLRKGDYEGAGEAFYNASLEIEGSAMVNLFLGVSLTGVGEYPLAAAALEEAYRQNPSVVSNHWNVAAHLGSQESYQTLVDTLKGSLEVSPSETGAWVSLAMLQLLSDESRQGLADVRKAAGEVVTFGDESPLARAILEEAERRDLGEDLPPVSRTPDPGVAQWLLYPSCEGIPTLSLGKN